VLEDADKAAAIKEYVGLWAQAQQWISDHPDEFAEAYYVDHEGLSPEDAAYVVDALGEFTVPTDWDEFIARHQETVDTLVEEQDQEALDVSTLYDRRFEKAIKAAVEGS
jgi:sulfonate transport system substrate-binding protein